MSKSGPTKIYLTMFPTELLPAGYALQLVDADGNPLGNQFESKLSQSAVTGQSVVRVSFHLDGDSVSWWQGPPDGES